MKHSAMTTLVAVLFAALFSTLVSCDSDSGGLTVEPFQPAQTRSHPAFRVQIVPDRSTPVEVSSTGTIFVYPFSEGREPIGQFPPGTVMIEPGDRGVIIGGEAEQYPNRCRLVSESGHLLAVRSDLDASKAYRYRGVVDVFKHSGVLRLINELSVEEYLLGVVGKEMQHASFTLEALKAQAIVARTFTLYHLRASGIQPPDQAFPATTFFQSYGGVEFESDLVVRAVRETSGQVLTFGSRIFQTYYHSACGGKTASGHVFNEKDIPPFKGVECGFCNAAPVARWQMRIDVQALQETMRGWAEEREISLGRLLGLDPVEVDSSGHGTYVRVRHSEGAFEIRADHLRMLVAASGQELPSAHFRAFLDEQSGQFLVEGHGYGHGVGLCQHGAGVMASAKDRNHGEILVHYFPDSGLKWLY